MTNEQTRWPDDDERAGLVAAARRVTLADAQREGEALGFSVRRSGGGDYRVSDQRVPMGAREATAYYTDDLGDAVATMKTWRAREAGGAQFEKVATTAEDAATVLEELARALRAEPGAVAEVPFTLTMQVARNGRQALTSVQGKFRF